MAGKRQNLIMAAVVISLFAVLPSCKHDEHGKSDEVTVHRGVGVVESIDRDTASIQINHEDIKDYMPAMSMPFPVKDKALLDAALPGDRVEFSLEVSSKGHVVTEIKRAAERGP
jgi:Cu/Ag efflux protein CusF